MGPESTDVQVSFLYILWDETRAGNTGVGNAGLENVGPGHARPGHVGHGNAGSVNAGSEDVRSRHVHVRRTDTEPTYYNYSTDHVQRVDAQHVVIEFWSIHERRI